MYDKHLTLQKLKTLGDLDTPVGSFIFSSLDLANLISLLVEELDQDARERVLDRIFNSTDLTSATLRQLTEIVDDYFRAPGKA